LYKLKNSKKWPLAQSRDRAISALGAVTIIGIALTVFWYLQWDSPRLADIIILLLYLVADVIILALIVKLAGMNIENSLKYLVLIIGEFVFINFIGDILFEARWLFSVGYILSYKTTFIINVIYNISLVFAVIALMAYNIKTKSGSLDKINRMLDDTKLFASDIIKNSPDAMCICDRDGNLATSNDLFTRMFGPGTHGDTGPYNLLKQLVTLEEYKAQLNELKQGNIIVIPKINGCLIARKDEPFYLRIKVFPTFGSDGKISNYVAIFEDITDNVLANETLKAAKNQAELYVDLMGHDINNMNQIAYGYLELALDKLDSDGKLEKDDQSLITNPIESMKNIANLIGNVRKIQRERSGAYKLETVDVGKMLENIRDQYSSTLREDLVINYVPETQCQVIANELLQDAFGNLVGNAIKHSHGPLTVDIIMSKVANCDRDYCKVIVQDNGPGIPDELKSTLFERLNLTESRVRGKGFGLCLVKMLVDDYNGKFWVEDRIKGDYSKGARFIILLPAVEKYYS
jgi:PAS domain S-box-containing protein